MAVWNKELFTVTYTQWAWHRLRKSSQSWCLERHSQSPHWSDYWWWNRVQWCIYPDWRVLSWHRCRCNAFPVDRPGYPANLSSCKASPHAQWHTRYKPTNEQSAKRCTWAKRGLQLHTLSIDLIFWPHGPTAADELSSAGQWEWLWSANWMTGGQRKNSEHHDTNSESQSDIPCETEILLKWVPITEIIYFKRS